MNKKPTKFIFPIFVIAVALLGFIPGFAVNFRLGKQILAEWVVMLFVALFFLKNKWLKAFLIWTLFRTIFGYNKSSYITLNTVFIFLVFYQVFADNLKKENITPLLNGICIIILVNLLWMFLQYCGVWIAITPLPRHNLEIIHKMWGGWLVISPPFHHNHITGLMSHYNMTSSLLALGLPAFFRKKWFWGIPLVWLGLVLAKSLGGIIPAGFAMLVWIWLKAGKHRYWLVSVSLLLCGAYLGVVEGFREVLGGTGRIGLWKEIMQEIIPKRWIVGWGVGQYKILYPAIHQAITGVAYIKDRMLQVHNEYLQLAVEQGIIGLGIAMGFIGSLVKKSFQRPDFKMKIALIALGVILINSGVNFLFHTTVGVLALVYMAIIDRGKI